LREDSGSARSKQSVLSRDEEAALTDALPQLFSLDPLHTDALDLFVSTCLAGGGVWDRPRKSDGISN